MSVTAPAPWCSVSTPIVDRERVARNARQFTKFAVVGGSGVVVNLAVFNATLIAWHLVTGRPLSTWGSPRTTSPTRSASSSAS